MRVYQARRLHQTADMGMDEMMRPPAPAETARKSERRAAKAALAAVGGVACRDADVESTRGIRSVALLFRSMSGLLVLLMVLQVVSGLTGTVDISYGVLFAEAIRLVIFAGLLWGAGDLAELFIKSHCDIRAMRILVGRLTRLMDERPAAPGAARPSQGDAGRERGDGVH
jgi:hypothetical protein